MRIHLIAAVAAAAALAGCAMPPTTTVTPAPGAAPVLVVVNFTPVPRHGYSVGVPGHGAWRELVNTDAAPYGGSDVGNGGLVPSRPLPNHGLPSSVLLTLPPLATLILRAE